MADIMNKKKRSETMAAIKSYGNKTTELAMLRLLRDAKVTGWRRHNKKLPGRPDFSFSKEKVALYLDGCFWHGCGRCYKLPKSNRAFWKNKVVTNRARDVKNRRKIRNLGWQYVRLWEHQIRKQPLACLERVEVKLGSKKSK